MTYTSSFSPDALAVAATNNEAQLIMPRTDGYAYYRHKASGLVYSLPFPSTKTIADYYDGFLFQKPASAAFVRMQQEIGNATSAITDELIQRFGANTGSLLDFGGGLGFYAAGFSNRFSSVTLYDVDPQACDYARSVFPGKFDVLLGSPGSDVPTEAKFDVVFASHVIEHYVDLPNFFAVLRRVTKPGGLIVIATPNNDTLEYIARPFLLYHYVRKTVGRHFWRAPAALAKLLSNSWLCCDPPRHIFALSAGSLRALAESNELQVKSVFTEYAWHSKYARVNDQTPEAGSSLIARTVQTLLNGYARVALSLIHQLDRRERRGGNLVMIARLQP